LKHTHRSSSTLSPLSEETLIEHAEQAKQCKDWPQAQVLWQVLSERFPTSTRYALEWSLASQKCEDFRTVIQACERILQQVPTYRTALYRKATALERCNQTVAAACTWKTICRRYPDEPTPWVRLIRLYRRTGHRNGAARLCQHALKTFPHDLDVLALAMRTLDAHTHCTTLGRIWKHKITTEELDTLPPARLIKNLSNAGDLETAIQLAEFILEKHPNDSFALKFLTKAYAQTGETQNLKGHLQLKLRQTPENEQVRWKLVRFFERQENWNDAATAMAPIIHNNANTPKTLKRYYNLLKRAKREDDANDTLWALCQCHPQQATNWLRLFRTLRDSGKTKQALRILEEALIHHPDNETLLLNHARLNWKESNWEQARQSWTSLTEITPSAENRYNVIRCCLRLELQEDARSLLYQFIGDFPNHDNGYRLLVRLLRQQRDFITAEKVCTQWLMHFPEQSEAWLNHIDCLLKLEKDKQLEKIFSQAETHLSHNSKHFINLAGIAERIDKSDKAVLYRDLAFKAGHFEELASHHLKAGRIGFAYDVLRTGAVCADNPTRCQIEQILQKLDTPLNGDRHALEQTLLPENAICAALRLPVKRSCKPNSVALVTRSLAAGGAERQVIATLTGLCQDQADTSFHLVCAQPTHRTGADFYAPFLHDLPVQIHHPRQEEDSSPLSNDTAALIDLMPPSFRRQVLGHYHIFKSIRPETVHIWQDTLNITAGLAAHLAGVPRIILSARTLPPLHPQQKKRSPRYLQAGYRALLQQSNCIFCTNSKNSAQAYANWLNIPLEKTNVIYNGLDITKLDIKDNRKDPPLPLLPENAPVIGSVFRFVWQKNPELWLKTAHVISQHRPDCHFLLVGDGPLQNHIHQLINHLGLQDTVHLVGRVNAVSFWLRRMDLFLMTSVVEGLPNVCIEAQACGLPIVATSAGGTQETFKHAKSGWATPVPDPDEISQNQCAETLAGHILWCLDHPEWLRSAQKHATKHARSQFSIAKLVSRTLDLYKNNNE